MKAKKNLYQAPVTEVFNIVLKEIDLAYALIARLIEAKEPKDAETAVLCVAFTSEWNLPTELMTNYILGWFDSEELQDEVVTWVTAQYHKSLAA